jgi:hypothetical protein
VDGKHLLIISLTNYKNFGLVFNLSFGFLNALPSSLRIHACLLLPHPARTHRSRSRSKKQSEPVEVPLPLNGGDGLLLELQTQLEPIQMPTEMQSEPSVPLQLNSDFEQDM